MRNIQKGVLGKSEQPSVIDAVTNTLPAQDAVAVRDAIHFASVSASGGDDTATINSKLTSARNSPIIGRKVVKLYGDIIISTPIILGSMTTLDATEATITLASGSNCHMVTNFSAYNPTATAYDGAITSGTSSITTSLASIANLGQLVCLNDAGGNGNGEYIGLIASKTATTLTITDFRGNTYNATATVSGKAIRLYNWDIEPQVIGGRWFRGSNGPDGTVGAARGAEVNGHSIFFKYTLRAKADIEYASSTHGISFIWTTASKEPTVGIAECSVVRTGIQLVGPIVDAVVTRCAGYCNDDLLSICGNVYKEQTNTCGNIDGVLVGPLIGRSGGASMAKINSGTGCDITGLVFSKSTGTSTHFAYIGEDTNRVETTGGTYGIIDLGNIDVVTSGVQTMLVSPTLTRLKLSPKTYGDKSIASYGSNTGRIGSIEVSGHILGKSITGSTVFTQENPNMIINNILWIGGSGVNNTNMSLLSCIAGVINSITMTDCSYTSPDSWNGTLLAMSTAGWIKNVHFHNGVYTNYDKLVAINSGYETFITTSGHVRSITGNRIFNLEASGVTVYADLSCMRRENPVAGVFYISNGTVVVNGMPGQSTTDTLSVDKSGGTIRATSINVKMDGTNLTGSAGDTFWNTNSSWSSGSGTSKIGAYGYTGSAWTKLFGPA